jgi:hypothetical protein
MFMLKKIIVLMGCVVVFGCGSSDKNAAVTAVDTSGSSNNSWGVPGSATSSWGVPSNGTSSWGTPSDGANGWGVTGGGTAAGGGGAGGAGAGGTSCTTQNVNFNKCTFVETCLNGGVVASIRTDLGNYNDAYAAVLACQ